MRVYMASIFVQLNFLLQIMFNEKVCQAIIDVAPLCEV